MAVRSQTSIYSTNIQAVCRCLAWESHGHTCKAPSFLGMRPGQGSLRGGRSRAKQVRSLRLQKHLLPSSMPTRDACRVSMGVCVLI